MNTRQLFGRARPYWRIAVVAIIGGLVAYLGSYAIAPTYTSSTKVLLRGRDTTLLTSTGENLNGEAGVIDSTLAVALGETQSALASSDRVAEEVVDRLNLDEPEPDEGGIVAGIKDGISDGFHRTRAYLTHGFYDEPGPREAAIRDVQSGLTATPLKDSYVLEITGAADTAQGAADIANTAADVLVALSSQRYQEEANQNRDFLSQQLLRTETAMEDAAEAKREYQQANGVTEIQGDLADGSTSRERIDDELRTAGVDLAALRAQLDVVNGQIAATNPTLDGQSTIETGRGTTEILTSEQNATYQALILDRDRLQGAIAAAGARQATLQGILDGDPASAQSAADAGLAQLDQRLSAAQTTYQEVNSQYQAAVLTAEVNTIEITRVGTAQVPTFPVSPVRYLYLFLGLLCGALAGAGLTWLRRPAPALDAEPEEEDLYDEDAYYDDEWTSASGNGNGDGEPIDLTTPLPLRVGGSAEDRTNEPGRTKVGRFEIFRSEVTDPS